MPPATSTIGRSSPPGYTNVPAGRPTTTDVPVRSVAWSEDGLFGCEFLQPIARAAVSAARLRSPFEPQPDAASPSVVAAPEVTPRPVVAAAVMLAFAVVAAMFVAALLTAPFAAF